MVSAIIDSILVRCRSLMDFIREKYGAYNIECDIVERDDIYYLVMEADGPSGRAEYESPLFGVGDEDKVVDREILAFCEDAASLLAQLVSLE